MTQKKTIILLAALCAAALVCMVLALRTGGERFTPPPFDAGAEAGTPTVPESAGYSQLDAQVYRVAAAGALRLEGDRVDVWLTNPAENEVWIKLRLLGENEEVLGESGLIRPGEYLRSVTLTDPPQETVTVVMKLMAYEPETYYSAGSVLLETQLTVD